MKLCDALAFFLLSSANADQAEPYSFKNFSYKLICYATKSVHLQQDTASCSNLSLALQNGSSNVFVGTVACSGAVWCPGGGDDILLSRLRAASSFITYAGGGGILLTWLCCSLLGLQQFGGPFADYNAYLAKVLRLHGFSRQLLSLTLCCLFMLLSLILVGCEDISDHRCGDIELRPWTVRHVASRVLGSLGLYCVIMVGITISKMIAVMREMPKDSYFLPTQKAEDFARQVLATEPMWIDRAVQMEAQRTKGCFCWENSQVSSALQLLAEPARKPRSREMRLEIEVRPVDDFTMHAIQDKGGYFAIEIDGVRLERTNRDVHTLHIQARQGSCGMDLFWSHFWPQFRANFFMLSLFQAAREARGSPEMEILRLRKSARLLPAEELRGLIAAATVTGPGGMAIPGEHGAVERVFDWRRRALRAALRSTPMAGGILAQLQESAMSAKEGEAASARQSAGDGGDIAPAGTEDQIPSWVFQGDTLEIEDLEPQSLRWKYGRASREDWFRLLGKAEYWLAHAYLELGRREPGLGHPLEAACEVLSAGLASGRLLRHHAGTLELTERVQKALSQELSRVLVAFERGRLDRLCASCQPVAPSNPPRPPPWIKESPSLLSTETTKCLIGHASHMLRFAMSARDKQALSFAIIETWRLCGDLLFRRSAHFSQVEGSLCFDLGRIAMDARQMYLSLVVDSSCASTGLAQLMLRQIYEQHSAFASPGQRANWAEQVRSPAFQLDMQAFIDLIGARGVRSDHDFVNTLACELEVVRVDYVAHNPSMQAYLSRREELKVCVHPKCAGLAADSLTVAATGPWTHNAIRRSQGMWADKVGYHFWLVAGEEVTNAAMLAAELLEPELAQQIRNDHGIMNFRALPWPHLLTRPESGDNDSDVSLVWVITQLTNTSRTNHKQINGVFQDGDLNVIFWHCGHKDANPARWDRSPVLFGHWWIAGSEALLLPVEVFLQGAVLLDQLTQNRDGFHDTAAHKVRMEATFSELRRHGAPAGFGAVLLYKGRFFPIWEDRPGMAALGHFRSVNFLGVVDKNNRRIEIQPCESVVSDPRFRLFTTRTWGFRKGIAVRLSPKPLDVNVNELFLVQGTRASIWGGDDAGDDTQNAQLQVLSSPAGTAVGPGIYLTDSAVKADQCTEPHSNGLCALLVCRACLGRIINQSEDDRSCTMRRGSDYHCIKLSGHINEFVIFDPAQVYVEYIVWYKRRAGASSHHS